jgi:hypothetical protein
MVRGRLGCSQVRPVASSVSEKGVTSVTAASGTIRSAVHRMRPDLRRSWRVPMRPSLGLPLIPSSSHQSSVVSLRPAISPNLTSAFTMRI